MRNLFLALVVANFAFAVWRYGAAPPDDGLRVTDSDVPSIALVSERDALDTAPAAAAPAEAGARGTRGAGEAPSGAGGGCVSVGPFRELAQGAAAAAALRDSGFAPAQRVAEGDIWIGYWVYIEDIPTRAEGDEILARLRENDMSDPYLIPGAEDGHVISLGIYTEVARAGRRRDEVEALGYDVTIADRTRRGTVYWIDVPLEAGETLDLDLLQPPGRIVRLEQRRCSRERSGAVSPPGAEPPRSELEPAPQSEQSEPEPQSER